MSETSESGTGKPRKRPAIKAANEQPTKKLKSTIHLSASASQRLDIHCTMLGYDRSGLVEHLITTHLRRFVVSDRRGSEPDAGDDTE